MGFPSHLLQRQVQIYKDADLAFDLIKKGDATKLAALLKRYSTPSMTKKFEENYAHRRNRSLNKHQLRDDLEAHWASPSLKGSATAILRELQKRNPLPPKVSFEKVTDAAIEAKWPATARTATRERLKNSAHWPSRYQHSTLISRMQDWGNWILDNYKYLMTSKNLGEIGLRFNPPQGGAEDADLEAIADFKGTIDNAYARLIQVCEKGPYALPVPSAEHRTTVPKNCLKTLRIWERVFTETKGNVSNNMRKSIRQRIQDLEERKRKLKPGILK